MDTQKKLGSSLCFRPCEPPKSFNIAQTRLLFAPVNTPHTACNAWISANCEFQRITNEPWHRMVRTSFESITAPIPSQPLTKWLSWMATSYWSAFQVRKLDASKENSRRKHHCRWSVKLQFIHILAVWTFGLFGLQFRFLREPTDDTFEVMG